MSVRLHSTSRQNLIANLSFDQLYAFQMVVRTGSFRSAASHLALSQPAVSQRMRHLEAVLGTPLFERRRGARASLTLTGRELSALADETLSNMDAFHRKLERLKNPSERSTLTIASGPDHIKYLLIQAVAALRRRDPRIRVVILQAGSVDQTVRQLVSGRTELGSAGRRRPRGSCRWGSSTSSCTSSRTPSTRSCRSLWTGGWPRWARPSWRRSPVACAAATCWTAGPRRWGSSFA